MTDEHDKPTVSREDLEAGAYFGGPGGASDWIEIGRRRMRHQIERHIEAILHRSGGRYKYAFPLSTERAFRMLAGLGYDADRKHYDYCIRHGHMEAPTKEGNRLLWNVDDVINFAMQLERMRYWLPGRHDEKKTVWELQAEVEATGKQWALDAQARQLVDGLDADAVMDLLAETADDALRATMSDYLAIRLYERGQAMDEVSEALLTQIVEDIDIAQRKALVTAMRKHFSKQSKG